MYIHVGDKIISLKELCCMLGIQPVNSIEVSLDNNKGQSIVTTVSDDPAFPSVMSYGVSEHEQYKLTRLELPNEDFPEDFTVRLFGGNERYEASDWIAMMKSNAFGKSVTGERFSETDELTKILYFERALVAAKGFEDYGTVPLERLPEHIEDVQ